MQNYESVLRYAMQMELDGHNFYMENKDKFAKATSKKMFLQLADIEMKHYEYLKSLLETYLDTNTIKLDPEIIEKEEDLDIFKEREDSEKIEYTLEQSDTPDLTILRMAYLIERDYKEFYQNVAENSDDEEIKEVFNTLAKWEAGHEALFKCEYNRLMKEYMNLPWGG